MPSRAAWVEIDLGAIAHNYNEIRRHTQKDAMLCAVVKADAYGHGAIAVARKAIAAGAEYLAVATISEALKLREAGFTTPLLILGLTRCRPHTDSLPSRSRAGTLCGGGRTGKKGQST